VSAAATQSERERRWLKRYVAPSAPDVTRLLCFHYAGGSAAIFRHWPALLPSVEVLGVQLPGRADRFTETPHERMGPLVEEVVEVLLPSLERPFACYGVSMGARVAWALAHALRDRGLPGPRALFVAASGGPSRDDGDWLWEDRDDGLEGYVREMGGTPPSVLAEPTLMAALLPVLRADLTVLSTHGFRPEAPLHIPIHAFAAEYDDEATPERMSAWREETAGPFSLRVLPSGHFLDPAAVTTVIGAVGEVLETVGAASPPAGPDHPAPTPAVEEAAT